MGRYKRHSRKTTTQVITPSKSNTSLRNVNTDINKVTISPKVRGIMSNVKDLPPKEKNPLANDLLREVVLSVKKRKKYANLLDSCVVNRKRLFLFDKGSLADKTYLNYHNHFQMLIGRKFLRFRGRLPYYSNTDSLYDSLVGRLCMIETLIFEKRFGFFRPNTCISKSDILKNYAKDYLIREKVKVYPNEIELQFLIGTMFAILTILGAALFSYLFLGTIFTIIWLMSVGIISLISTH